MVVRLIAAWWCGLVAALVAVLLVPVIAGWCGCGVR